MSKNVFNISNELMSNAYPGRGIIFGRTLDNTAFSPRPRTASAQRLTTLPR